MNCQRCNREITKEDSFNYQNRILCEDCYIELGLHPRECDPWETYSATNTPGGAGPTSKLELTDQQKKVLEMLAQQGKIARDSLITDMKLSEAEVDAIVTTLLRAELAKIVNEGGAFYLVPLPYNPPKK
jgi:hypothetical protein